MPEEIEIKQAEQKKIDEQKKLDEKKRELMDKDDTYGSTYAKDFLSQKDPTCRNYTFSEIYGKYLKYRKYTDMEHANQMDKKFLKVDALYLKENEQISGVFRLESNGKWELWTKEVLGQWVPGEHDMTWILITLEARRELC